MSRIRAGSQIQCVITPPLLRTICLANKLHSNTLSSHWWTRIIVGRATSYTIPIPMFTEFLLDTDLWARLNSVLSKCNQSSCHTFTSERRAKRCESDEYMFCLICTLLLHSSTKNGVHLESSRWWITTSSFAGGTIRQVLYYCMIMPNCRSYRMRRLKVRRCLDPYYTRI